MANDGFGKTSVALGCMAHHGFVSTSENLRTPQIIPENICFVNKNGANDGVEQPVFY